MAKITVKSCEFKQEITKKDGSKASVYIVTDSEGKKYNAFEEFEIGEQEVTTKENGTYDPNIFKVKAVAKSGFPQKDYKFEKRKAALEMALKHSNSIEGLLMNAEKIEQWINR